MESSPGKVDGADTQISRPAVTELKQTKNNQSNSFWRRFWAGVCGGVLRFWSGIFSLWGGTSHDSSKDEEDDEDVVVYTGVAQISKKRVAFSFLVQTDLVDFTASMLDRVYDFAGRKIQMQLVSEELDNESESPKLSATSHVEGWVTNTGDVDLVADYDEYKIRFKVPKAFGEIGAVVVKNCHPNECYLQSLTLEGPSGKKIIFKCLAWIHPHARYSKDRVFFTSTKFLPNETPEGLKLFREQELDQIRGDGTGTRKPWERIYDYDFYNDYGNPDEDITLARPVLGGNQELPYPRRNRTGRPMSKADPNAESRLEGYLDVPYIPSDEFFARTKNSTFVAAYIKGAFHSVLPTIKSAFQDRSRFSSREEIEQLFVDGLPKKKRSLSECKADTADASGKVGAIVYLSQFLAPQGDNQSVLKYPMPDVVKHGIYACEMDEEFGRQTLAGLNPSVIQAVKEYPPKCSLDPSEYGEGTALTDEDILPFLEGLSVAEAISQKRLFTIDYRDVLLSLVALANADKKKVFKLYSPRAIFFYTEERKMMPVAIELSLPSTEKGTKVINRVFTPADTDNHLWGLAKIHFTSVDSNYHQVYSHFTETHAAIEPFIIATRRQISALHPIFPLLVPHFKDTMNINAAAREILIAGGGQIEENFSFGAQAMPAGAKAYGALWRFDHLNPARRLVHRGLAVPADESYPGGVKLVIEDYPFAKDSLDLWDALYKWARSYLSIVYKGSDEAVKNDKEIQAWWHEIRYVGHGDHKDAPWWPEMDSIDNLADAVASMGYIAGPYHAAVNFGQYAYGAYPLNKPTGTRRFIPEIDSEEYDQLEEDPEAFLLETITSPFMATTALTVLELLATHAVDEEYIGSKSLTVDYTAIPELAAVFEDFATAIENVEKTIIARNKDKKLFNRHGQPKVPYTLLQPSSTSGLTGQGVPYSTSI